MSKILVSDFYGTLISNDPGGLEYFYSKGSNHLHDLYEIYKDKEYFYYLMNKAFIQLGKQLRDFLSDGNYIKLVTAMDSHDNADFMFNELISRFYESIKEYKNQVSIFFTNGVGNRVNDLSKVAKISQRNGYLYVENENGISAYIINDKTEVFDFVKKEHDLKTDELFAIGDTCRDIPMLFKCIEYGGKSSLINNYLYNPNQSENITTDSIIRATVELNFQIMLESLACKLYPNFNNMDKSEQADIIEKLDEEFEEQYSEWAYNEYNKLYTSLDKGEFDLNELMKNIEIFNILSLYNRFCDTSTFFNKTIRFERVSDLSMYPTFVDYCNKVLVHKKI